MMNIDGHPTVIEDGIYLCVHNRKKPDLTTAYGGGYFERRIEGEGIDPITKEGQKCRYTVCHAHPDYLGVLSQGKEHPDYEKVQNLTNNFQNILAFINCLNRDIIFHKSTLKNFVGDTKEKEFVLQMLSQEIANDQTTLFALENQYKAKLQN